METESRTTAAAGGSRSGGASFFPGREGTGPGGPPPWAHGTWPVPVPGPGQVVPKSEWSRIGTELMDDAVDVRRAEREESIWWAHVLGEAEEALAAAAAAAHRTEGEGEDGGGLPGRELDAGLTTASRGIGQAALTMSETTLLLEEDLRGGLGRLGDHLLAAEAAQFTIALEAFTRGLPGQTGFGLVDWLALRCPWASRHHLGDIDAVARASSNRLNAPLVEAVAAGRTPVRRGAILARALAKLAPVLDPDGYEEFVRIFLDAACQPTISDRGLREIMQTALQALLDEEDKTRREKLAREARSFTSRRLGNGLTRYTIDTPEDDAAILDGIITSKLAAPSGTKDDPDTRTSTQRRYDAFITILGRGTTCPTGTPTMPRATLMITMALSDLLGQTRGAGLTTTGQVLSAGQVRQLACEAELIPVVLGTKSQILDVGREHRLATPAQVKALRYRDKGCTFPGCTVPPEWCIAHHIIWWKNGGRTDMDTLALLCEQHHTHVHTHELEADVIDDHVTWHV